MNSPQASFLHDIRMNLHFPTHSNESYSDLHIGNTKLFGEKYEWCDSFILEDLVIDKSSEHDEVLEESVKLMKELVEVMKETQSILKQIEEKVLLNSFIEI